MSRKTYSRLLPAPEITNTLDRSLTRIRRVFRKRPAPLTAASCPTCGGVTLDASKAMRMTVDHVTGARRGICRRCGGSFPVPGDWS